MRTRIITLITAILFAGTLPASAQSEGYTYKPWAEYQNDTLKYLKENFYLPSIYFRDRSVSDLLDRLEIPIKGVYYRKSQAGDYVDLISFVFCNLPDYQLSSSYSLRFFITVRLGDAPPPFSKVRGIVGEPGILIPYTPEVDRFLRRLTFGMSAINTMQRGRMRE